MTSTKRIMAAVTAVVSTLTTGLIRKRQPLRRVKSLIKLQRVRKVKEREEVERPPLVMTSALLLPRSHIMITQDGEL